MTGTKEAGTGIKEITAFYKRKLIFFIQAGSVDMLVNHASPIYQHVHRADASFKAKGNETFSSPEFISDAGRSLPIKKNYAATLRGVPSRGSLAVRSLPCSAHIIFFIVSDLPLLFDWNSSKTLSGRDFSQRRSVIFFGDAGRLFTVRDLLHGPAVEIWISPKTC